MGHLQSSETVTSKKIQTSCSIFKSINEYATFVNETGENITLELQEELNDGVKIS